MCVLCTAVVVSRPDDPPQPPELTAERVGDGELLLAGTDRQEALRAAPGLRLLGPPQLHHVFQLLQPLLRARDELGVPDLQRFLVGAKEIASHGEKWHRKAARLSDTAKKPAKAQHWETQSHGV